MLPSLVGGVKNIANETCVCVRARAWSRLWCEAAGVDKRDKRMRERPHGVPSCQLHHPQSLILTMNWDFLS